MNQIEFLSKTIFFYSLIKNERIDLSFIPDDVFDRILHGLSDTRMCKEGSAFTGKYIKNSTKAAPFIELLNNMVNGKYWPLKKIVAYIDGLADGDVFWIVSEDAPTMNKQLALLKTRGLTTNEDERIIHNNFIRRFGLLSTRYRHYAFGYDGIKTVIGVANKEKRVCRFCKKQMPEVSYKEVAHAISEGLGNKKLICNEECDDCNNKLSKVESNLIHYLDVRRAMGGILSKTDGKVPSVDGKGFVIRSDNNNQAVLFIEKEWLDEQGTDVTRSFQIRLETFETITHQGIYKALCKIVIDLLPASELNHFHETIEWINGSVMDNELPPYYASYDYEHVSQPTVDIYLSKNSGKEPYCTAIVHILDVLFAFIVPEVDVDKARYKTGDSVLWYLASFMTPYRQRWQVEDSSEYTLSYPWVDWVVEPNDPQVQIRSKSDPIFMRYNREGLKRKEHIFPPFDSKGIEEPVISESHFVRHSSEIVTEEELYQVSVNYNKVVCRLDQISSSIFFSMDFNFSDSSNRLSYFDFNFNATVRLDSFEKYIVLRDYFCIDYHLRDYLCRIVLTAAQKELKKHTIGTDFEPITLEKLLDKRAIRQLHYIVPVDRERYMIVKDAQLHN